MTITLADMEKVMAYELSQVGYHEDSHGGTKFGAWYSPPFYKAAWCAMFQSYSHYRQLGYSPFPATSDKGAASCYALQQWAMRHGWWVDGDHMPKRHDLVLYKWAGDDIVHHVAKVIVPRGIREVQTVGGNEGNAVRIAERHTLAIQGYVRIPFVDVPVPPPSKPKPKPHPIFEENDVPAIAYRDKSDSKVYSTVADPKPLRWHIPDNETLQFLVITGAVKVTGPNGSPAVLDHSVITKFTEIK